MCKKIYLLFFFGLLISGCQSDPSSNDKKSDALVIELICESAEEINGIPQSAIFAHVGENRIKILELPNCSIVSKEGYAALQIPQKAIIAAGGQFEGKGHYVYALKEDQKVLFFEGMTEEAFSEDQISYQPLVTFENGKFYFQ